MGRLWTLLTHVHAFSGPVLMLLYPLYASVMAIENPSKMDDEQWLAYWIIYSFLTLTEMVFQFILEWIPVWYTLKLVLVAWLVLPQFRGAAFIYERYVRENVKKYTGERHQHHSHHSSGKPKTSDVYYNEYINRKRGLQASSTLLEKKEREGEILFKENASKTCEGGKIEVKVWDEGKLEVENERGYLDGEDEPSLPAEELNKRADDFIARVNRQRRLEARLLLD
ncbi:hypothetical protein GH714_024343 [Hevea brasiliensis]|uniref:HVA22-like protein n=2 Tax=Hevea brasiliensis TaxID=3981 RepID=A0A6A6MH67_HEVBR|nr:hypothetical protein GH714_024343 [Hevea brasiliensis]